MKLDCQKEIKDLNIIHELIVKKCKNFNERNEKNINELEVLMNTLKSSPKKLQEIKIKILSMFDDPEMESLFEYPLDDTKDLKEINVNLQTNKNLLFSDSFSPDKLMRNEDFELNQMQTIGNDNLKSQHLIYKNDDFFCPFYDSTKNQLILISLPLLDLKQIKCKESNIPSIPSITLFRGKLIISGGFLFSKYEQSKETFIILWSGNSEDQYKIELKSQMNYKKQNHALISIGDNNVYSIGGFESSAGSLQKCEKYSLELNKWQEISPMIDARQDFALCQINLRYIYVIAGCSNSSTVTEYYTNILKYDTSYNNSIWESIQIRGEGVEWMAISNIGCIALNDSKILIFGGKLEKSQENVMSNKCYEMDIASKSVRNTKNYLAEEDYFIEKYVCIAKFQNSFCFVSKTNKVHFYDKITSKFSIKNIYFNL